MCGFIGTTQKVYRQSSIKNILKHRGPDAVSVYGDGDISLFHNRLSIIDLTEDANQPMIDESNGNVIVFNGEVYNYRELRSRFALVDWKSNSDTEVILKLFALLGPGVVELLNGIFAFAVYSPQEKRIHMFRDRFGVKPFYYASAKGLSFASEIKGILPFMGAKLNLSKVADYLVNGLLAHDDDSFFDGIRALPAAHYAVYDLNTDSMQIQRYWDVTHDLRSIRESHDDQVMEEVHSLLLDSARLNLTSDVEVGLSLSSGTDSTLLLKLLQKHHPSKFRAFTFGFDDPLYDEVRRVQENSFLDDVSLSPVYLQKNEMLQSLKNATYFFETPLGGLGTLSAYNMMQEVNKAGIKVMLAGEGSDESFGGYQYYYGAHFVDLESEGDTGLLKEIMKYNEAHGSSTAFGDAAYCKLKQACLSDRVYAPDGTTSLCSHTGPALIEYISKAVSPLQRPFAKMLTHVMYQDLTIKKLPKLLHFQDRASMANSVESRVPYLDHRLVSLLYSLPSLFKIRNGKNKWLLRRILKEWYDFSEPYNIKHYVATPQREWLKDSKIRDEILETVCYGVITKEKLIDFHKFHDDYMAYSQSPELGNSFFVWKIINLEYLLGQEWDTRSGCSLWIN